LNTSKARTRLEWTRRTASSTSWAWAAIRQASSASASVCRPRRTPCRTGREHRAHAVLPLPLPSSSSCICICCLACIIIDCIYTLVTIDPLPAATKATKHLTSPMHGANTYYTSWPWLLLLMIDAVYTVIQPAISIIFCSQESGLR